MPLTGCPSRPKKTPWFIYAIGFMATPSALTQILKWSYTLAYLYWVREIQSHLSLPNWRHCFFPGSFSLFRVQLNLHLLQEACLAIRAHWRAPSSLLMAFLGNTTFFFFHLVYIHCPMISGTSDTLKMWTALTPD